MRVLKMLFGDADKTGRVAHTAVIPPDRDLIHTRTEFRRALIDATQAGIQFRSNLIEEMISQRGRLKND